MTVLEQLEAKRTSRVIRAARKLRGKSQSSLAKVLDISQAAFSKIEKGQVILSSSRWFAICSLLEIPPEVAFKKGVIDTLIPVDREPSFPDHSFKMPRVYLKHTGSTVRTVRAVMDFFEKYLGQEKLLEYLKSKKIDPDFFVIFDNPISIGFALDMMTTLIQQGILNQNNISEMTAMIATPEYHGKAYHFFQNIEDQKSLIKILIEKIGFYEANFQYSIVHETHNRIDITATPSDLMKYVKYDQDFLDRFLREQKRTFLMHFSTLNGGNRADVSVIETYYNKRNTRCTFMMRF